MPDYDKDNIFAKILQGDIPSTKVYEDDYTYAFEDISQAAPVHVLVVPKADYISFDDFMLHASDAMIQHFFKAVQTVAQQMHIRESGYRIIMNHGADASQSVPHFHAHILGGKALGGLIPGDTEKR